MASDTLWAVFTVEIPHFAPRLWEVPCLRLIVKHKDVTETHAGAGLWLGTPERREAPAAGSRVPIAAEAPVLLRRGGLHLGARRSEGAAASCGSSFTPTTFSLFPAHVHSCSCRFPGLCPPPLTHYLLKQTTPLGPFLALSPPWARVSALMPPHVKSTLLSPGFAHCLLSS